MLRESMKQVEGQMGRIEGVVWREESRFLPLHLEVGGRSTARHPFIPGHCSHMKDFPIRPRLCNKIFTAQQDNNNNGLTWARCDKAWRAGCPDNLNALLKHRCSYKSIDEVRYNPAQVNQRSGNIRIKTAL